MLIFWPYALKCNKIRRPAHKHFSRLLWGAPLDGVSTDKNLAVAKLYNRFPYPNYPLLARPCWQDGFLASSFFAGRLAVQPRNGVRQQNPPRGDVLVAGCGEILPYIIRKWEPLQATTVNVDLSRRSLRRARFRTALSRGKSEFHEADIVSFLDRCGDESRTFAHIETFGMLHHMNDPAPAIVGMVRQLAPGGTFRVMVYNSPARDWIHALQDYFAEIDLSIDNNDPLDSIKNCRKILADFATRSPLLADRLRAIGPHTMGNPARVADTFLHPQELRWPISRWFELFASAGLRLTGIYDRYGELDDLPNPLLADENKLDLSHELTIRAADRRFEGNLEMIWTKDPKPGTHALASTLSRSAGHLMRLKFMRPPHIWFDFEETRNLSTGSKMQIWHAFIDARKLVPSAWGKNHRTLQRLARLGAILPDQLDPESAKIASEPLEDLMSPPDIPHHAPLAKPDDRGPHTTALRKLDAALLSSSS